MANSAEPGEAESAFPRGTGLPPQSPLFWVNEKDRYLRQLFIRDIEECTGRQLVVYFAECETADIAAQILPSDDAYLAELFRSVGESPVDILLETNGGYTDATEKVVAMIRAFSKDVRVIVPRRAKSNGTLVALAAKEIVMGPVSELGPIDPNITVGPGNQVPAQFLLQVEQLDPVLKQAASYAVAQTRKLATSLLTTGMMREKSPGEIEDVVNKLATRELFHSHGSVIDADEAAALGLRIHRLSDNDDLWKRFWLLRCMYAYDARKAQLVKIFEGRKISNSLRASKPA